MREIRFEEVVIIVIDEKIKFEKKDLKIEDIIIREGSEKVIDLKKWDMIEERKMVMEDIYEKKERIMKKVRGIREVKI